MPTNHDDFTEEEKDAKDIFDGILQASSVVDFQRREGLIGSNHTKLVDKTKKFLMDCRRDPNEWLELDSDQIAVLKEANLLGSGDALTKRGIYIVRRAIEELIENAYSKR